MRKYKLEEIMGMSGEELKKRLRDIYKAQQLSPGLKFIARTLDIIILASFIFLVEMGWIYKGIAILGLLYTIYKIVAPKSHENDILESLDEVVEAMENFKKYKNNELSMKCDEKLIKSTEKNITKSIQRLLNVTSLDKISALIPLLNISVDENQKYESHRGALHFLMEGSLSGNGLKSFLNKNLDKLKTEE